MDSSEGPSINYVTPKGGRGVWPDITVGFFSYLSQSEFRPKVLHGGGGGQNFKFLRNIIY